MELIVSPTVLFLDEPTTGLDAFTAATVMHLVYQLARRGKTVIFAIHQPRFSIFRSFDTITLLAKGQILYHGSSATALPYFEQLGYVSEQYENPADFFLDIIQSSIGQLEANSSLSLATKYQSSEYAELVQKEIDAIHNIKQDGFEKLDTPNFDYPTTSVHQFLVLSKRSLQNIIRTPTLSLMKVANHFLAGLAIGGVYYHVSDDPEHAIQNRVGAIFSMVMVIIFSNVIGLKVFIEQKSLFIQESVSGYYHLLPYFLAKITCDVIATKVIPTIVFSIIAYSLIGMSVGQPWRPSAL
jgi:ATP-binding cassette subfamily G (WHITE) protein 2